MASRDRKEWIEALWRVVYKFEDQGMKSCADYYRAQIKQLMCPERTSFQGVRLTDKKGEKRVSE